MLVIVRDSTQFFISNIRRHTFLTNYYNLVKIQHGGRYSQQEDRNMLFMRESDFVIQGNNVVKCRYSISDVIQGKIVDLKEQHEFVNEKELLELAISESHGSIAKYGKVLEEAGGKEGLLTEMINSKLDLMTFLQTLERNNIDFVFNREEAGRTREQFI